MRDTSRSDGIDSVVYCPVQSVDGASSSRDAQLVTGFLAAFACISGEYTVRYVVGTTVCILLLLQWAFWQITHPEPPDESRSRPVERLRGWWSGRRKTRDSATDEQTPHDKEIE